MSTFVECTKVCVDEFGDDSETYADDRGLAPGRVSGCGWEGVLVRPVALSVSLGEPWTRGTCDSGKGRDRNQTASGIR